MSRRFMDMNAEQELATYLDNAFYGPLMKAKPNYKWERYADKGMQLKGVDGILSVGETQLVIDEKATLYYINKDIPTFAFEINSYQHGRLTDGWLFAKEYETTHYLLVWPKATTTDLRYIKASDFRQCWCYLVERKKIIDYLASRGFTKERIHKDALAIRKEGKFGRLLIPGITGFNYYLSHPSNYSEAPLNIVIRRDILRELAIAKYCTK